MKFAITRSNEVGKAEHGWLHAKHYFSFANYYNPKKMGFGKLRVINDDVVEAGQGFATHPHRDMEIITIPQFGAVRHEDSAGNKGVVAAGDVQVMSAGRGILHSEFNASKEQPLNLFQIWIETEERGVSPRYDQAKFDYRLQKNKWVQLVSPMSLQEEEGLKIHQQAFIRATLLEGGKSLDYQVKGQSNGVYFLVASGQVEVAGQVLSARDAIAIEEEQVLNLKALEDSEVIAIEVPMV